MNNFRKRGWRKQKTPIVFYGKGDTEFYYLTHLKELKYRKLEYVDLMIRKSNFNKSNSFEKIQRKIKKEIKGIDGIAILMEDCEQIVSRKDNSFYKIIRSRPSIEYWFLLHYEDTNRSFGEQELKKYLRNIYIHDYSTEEEFLRDELWVKNMTDNLEKAYDRAKKYTNINLSFSEFPKLIDLIKKKENTD
ncbi:MAG: RloB domain-containing protein [Elusimicrobiota bacterium]